jgi:hypothetical protein
MENLAFLKYDKMSSIDDVEERFRILEKRLMSSEYKLLHNFNRAYLIITKNVRKKMQEATFDDPQFLSFFDSHFAKYYLEALDNYLRGKSVPPAWHQAFEASYKGKKSALVLMALGINAHVNNDICQVLRDCRADKRHYGDYKKINTIIRRSIYEVIDNIDDHNHRPIINPKKRLMKPLYKIVMTLLIYLWRRNAWRNYQKIKSHDKSVREIENFAFDRSQKLTRLPL